MPWLRVDLNEDDLIAIEIGALALDMTPNQFIEHVLAEYHRNPWPINPDDVPPLEGDDD